jgi:RHS repeat-associated protein
VCACTQRLMGPLVAYPVDGDSVVSEVTGTSTVNTLRSPVVDQPLLRNRRYFAPNQLGSTTKLTDAAGVVGQSYDYSPFGETPQSTGESNPFQYAGRENDGTGVYYNRARYYVPEWGRFMSEDPLGFAGGLNRYTYADNNPLAATDPLGFALAPLRSRSQLENFIDWWNEDPPPPIWTGAFWQRFWHNLHEDVHDVLGTPPGNIPIGPGPVRLPILDVPSGMTPAEFGQKVMRWGTGAEAARARIATLTREELEEAGVTREMVEAWRNFYRNELLRNPNNGSAAGRIDLMQRAAELLWR